ncbi:MAG TPA: hypothetical protein VMT25_06420 [Thermoanaerobaculia bacterium]|nr:hypothetical protein [Thermoanaerobaculia bacterium]
MIRPLVLALLLASAPSGPVSFPGAAEAKDPTGRYAVVGAAASGSHALDLRNLKTGVSRLLQPYGLAAVVLWSPDGGAVAVTDRDNRETSSARVFFPDRPGAPVDLGAELERAFPAMGERTGNSHVYVEAVRWVDAKTLRFRLRGYGARDPGGFDLLFDYALGGAVRRARSV